MAEQNPFYLIVGLGNPGKAYENTRHNIGFRVVEALANKYRWSFKKTKNFHGEIAEGVIGDKKVILLKPQTYMNSSGEAVQACCAYYKMPLTQLLVITDDVYLPFGNLRVKTSGGSGGHNGLKSIASHLGTQAHARLKVGVSNKEGGGLADYVLAPFQEEEQQKLPDLLLKAVEALELWLKEGIVSAMQCANRCREERKSEQTLGE